jgi:ubiquinone biosynthesis protein
MFRRLSDTRRLWHAARVLARNDALCPKEYEALLPPWARLARRLLGSGRAKNVSAPPGIRLAQALESLGPAYIKLGQVLATRADIVGDDVAFALAQLQDRLPPFPMAQSRAVIAQSLARPVDTVFSALSEPIAAASIAQVHDGMTADEPPVRVAVKVLRPGIAVEFGKDLSAFAFAARLAERFVPEARRLRPSPWSTRWRLPLRSSSICAWKRPVLPNWKSARAPTPNFACPTSTGAAPPIRFSPANG